MSELFALFGHPVGHSMSPLMHNDQFKLFDMPHHYHAFDVDPDHLKEAVEGLKALNIKGCNVTVPHKVEIMKYLDEIDHEAELIGAVNTIVNDHGKLIGYNTDGQGYLDSLLAQTDSALKDMKVLVIGAGGAARAVLTVLARYGPAEIVVTNRTFEKAEMLAERLKSQGEIKAVKNEEAKELTKSFDLFINTTSVGMSPNVDDIPWDVQSMKEDVILSDLIYNPLKTKWLTEGEKQGAKIMNGVGMFVRQGALAFEMWTGQKPDINRMNEVVLQNLGGNR